MKKQAPSLESLSQALLPVSLGHSGVYRRNSESVSGFWWRNGTFVRKKCSQLSEKMLDVCSTGILSGSTGSMTMSESVDWH